MIKSLINYILDWDDDLIVPIVKLKLKWEAIRYWLRKVGIRGEMDMLGSSPLEYIRKSLNSLINCLRT